MFENSKHILAFLISVCAAVLVLWWFFTDEKQPTLSADISSAMSSDDRIEQYERALGPRTFNFPDDFGPHPGFQTEWWYYTGNITTKKGRQFGYQLTFFRRAISPVKTDRKSAWATNQIYFAHFAITDIRENQFHSFERFSRKALGLAGSQAKPYKVWIENWQAKKYGDAVQLEAREKNISLQLIVSPQKPIVLQGDRGFSKKGSKPGNASFYFSQTRLLTEGKIVLDSDVYEVNGLSWLDREWSTSALEKGDIGWDWFSIQLEDQREIMLFQIRNISGSKSKYSSAKIIEKDGSTTLFSSDAFSITNTGWWKSPYTGIQYPSGWEIRFRDRPLVLKVFPKIKNQEHWHSFVYWEGAVAVDAGETAGVGYVELTGYEKP